LKNKYLTLFIFANVLVLVDQYSKFLVTTHLPLYYSIEVIQGVFNLTHIRNPGVAFGLFAGMESQYKAWIFVFISTVAIIAILVIYHHTPKEHRMVRVGLILIFSGAIGNVIDRIVYQEVIDFLDVFYKGYHWPAFNFADSCITIGVGLMILDLFQKHPKQLLSSNASKESMDENQQ
jgi:signal peptidase II